MIGGPPGGGTVALLDAVLSVGAPRPLLEQLDRRAVVDVYAFARMGGTLPLAPLRCESCQQQPAELVVILPGACRVSPFLVCRACRP